MWRTDRLATVIVPGTRDVQASFAPVAEAVGPAVVNINSVTRFSGRTPIEEFFGDEFFRRFFGEAPERHPSAERHHVDAHDPPAQVVGDDQLHQ